MSGTTHEGPARLSGLTTRLLALAATHSDRVVNEALAGADARKWHYAVLATLDEFGPASQAQLSDRTRIYRSDIVAVVNELAERGQVERAPNPDDRRQNVITITTAGRRQLGKLDKLLKTAQDEVLAPLAQEERDQLAHLLRKLARHDDGRPAT
ncbi:DNA-binding MarR family transcriptional regulator [Asanoa ferruginea]|uniref:DNA-binding MarR family transcriptional regulator n=1 Tax=Asanoa ferruginea TaxID=53367 RepID=A0A3D9ZTU2_9ACTN|nr:MarR family winged helix-turn-helix transcriptional regulator [Asanoa ferruginea]REG00578.1 DNA-binding MarR family transcriptional regulator [Asanoa ferruginea]